MHVGAHDFPIHRQFTDFAHVVASGFPEQDSMQDPVALFQPHPVTAPQEPLLLAVPQLEPHWFDASQRHTGLD